MFAFLLGAVVGAIGFWLVVDNNEKIALTLKTVKKLVKEKID